MVKSNIISTIFTVIIRPCDEKIGGYYAICDMPNGGCTTQGETMQETQKNIFESIQLYLEDYPEISDYYLNFEVQDAKYTDS